MSVYGAGKVRADFPAGATQLGELLDGTVTVSVPSERPYNVPHREKLRWWWTGLCSYELLSRG